MELIDIALAPGFDPSALNAGVVEGVTGGQVTADGRTVNAKVRKADPEAEARAHSVSRGCVYWGLPASGGGMPTVCCREHGATLCVAANSLGKIWRCPACNEGAFQFRPLSGLP